MISGLQRKLPCYSYNNRIIIRLKQCFTICDQSEHIEIIKKSKFIGRVSSASSYEEAIQFINKVKDDKATHNCWAYRSLETSRCNDDGEVAGTAGRPMLNILETENLVDTVIVVTRYYGGIKLGTGGLLRAYSGVARDSVLKAGKSIVMSTCIMTLRVDQEDIGTMYQVIQQLQGKYPSFRKLSEDFQSDAQGVVFLLQVYNDDFAAVEKAIGDACRGRQVLTVL